MNKEHCIFVGNYYSDYILNDCNVKNLSLGNDNYEKNFVSILSLIYKKVTVLSFMALPVFSRKNKCLFVKKEVNYRENVTEIFLPFINTRFLNFRNFIIYKYLKKYIKKNDHIDIFFSTYHTIDTLVKVKKNFKYIHSILLLPDLPYSFDKKYSPLMKLKLKKANYYLQNYNNKIDLLLPITKFQTDLIKNFHGRKFIYESFFDDRNFLAYKKTHKKKNILYAGNLDISYGIKDLVNQFIESNIKKYKLVICGWGNYAKELYTISKNQKNIVYLGLLSKNEVLKLEATSTFLIVPDKNNRKYSFHSRYLEYFNSGTPTITYVPDGMKNEYRKFIIPITREEHGIKKSLISACSMNKKEIDQMSLKMTNYMSKNKTREAFASKLLYELEKL